MRGKRSEQGASGRWKGLLQGVADEARGRPTWVLSVWSVTVRSTRSGAGLLTLLFWSHSFIVTIAPSLSTLPARFSSHPPILHPFIWHVPALIVQAEPLALFKIWMLFLYSSKRRHVEALLNCSANRWRFSRCLYEIKWNIPIKKTLSFSLSDFFSFFWCDFFLFLSSCRKVTWLVLPITASTGEQLRRS